MEMHTQKKSIKKAVLIYLIASLFLVFEMGVQVSPSVMAPDLMHDLHLGAFTLGLMSGFYFYTYTFMQVPSGLLLDRHKPKAIITISILICATGSLVFGLASNYYWGCLARLLTGFGSAFAFVSVLVVASDLFHEKTFALLTGITQMLAAFGAMLGQIPVSLLVDHLGWRPTMFLLSGIGFILALAAWLLINYEKAPKNFACQFSSNLSVKKSLKLILVNPQNWFIALYACLLWAPMSGFASLWGVPFLVKADGLTTTSAAFYCSFMWLGLAIISPLLGAFSALINSKWFALVFSSLIGTMAFGFILKMSISGWQLGVCLFLAGGACAGQALSFAVVQENNSPSVKATAIAFNNMAVVISGAIFQPLIGNLISSNETSFTHDYSLSNYQRGMWVIFIAYLASLIIAGFFIKKKSVALYSNRTWRCEQNSLSPIWGKDKSEGA
jgi:MFS family permease